MLLERLSLGSYAANCYILADDLTKEAMVIDPGAEVGRIIKKISDHNLIVKCIVITHGHGDHIGAVEALRQQTKAPVWIHHEDAFMLEDASKNLSTSTGGAVAFSADKTIGDRDIIQLGSIKINVLHTPGHTQGGICLHVPSEKMVFTGDTLFYGSVGRSDLMGGNHKQLIQSIIEKLMVLSDDVTVYPGHGASSTIGFERRKNPFIQG